jgi:hypothetical protein
MAAQPTPLRTATAPRATLPVLHRPIATDALSLLAGLVALLALGATLVGLFWPEGNGPFSLQTVRGETVQLFGQGIYRYDTLFQGAINRGTDAVTLALGIPLLVCSTLLYRRGSLRGRLLLTSVLAFFLYVYANAALGAAYNTLYLVYVALFSASLFAFVLSFTSIDRQALSARLLPSIPRRALAIFMFVAGVVTLAVWLSDVVGALAQGQPTKHLDSYTTLVTYVLDLGIIAPACFLTGTLLFRRVTLGYPMAVSLLGILVLLAPSIIAATVSQLAAGVSLSLGEIIGPVVGFMCLGVIAIWLLSALLLHISEGTPPIVASEKSRVQ